MMDIVCEVLEFTIHGHFELYRYEEIDPFWVNTSSNTMIKSAIKQADWISKSNMKI